MADENVITAAETVAPTQPDHQAELAQMMALSLNGGAQAQEPVVSDVPPVNEPVTQGQPGVDVVSDPFDLFKNKFGYENQEAAFKEIEELRAFKAQPRNPEFTVPDDDSAAILRALAAGKKEDVYKFLHHEMQIERLLTGDVNKDSAAEIVKMGMQLKYKDLTPDEINYKFNKQFSLPSEPKQSELEEDADYQSRVASWKDQVMDKQMELMIEAKMVKPELHNAKGKLTIPEIATPVDEGYAQYQQMLAQKAQDDTVTKEAYKALTPKAIETRINFKDESNKIDFEYQYEPDVEGFAKAVQTACDADLFWQTFAKPDGTPDREKFLDAIYYVNNKEKVLTSAMNQAKNATIKAGLPDNSQPGLIRQIAQTQEPDELREQMGNSLRGYGGWK